MKDLDLSNAEGLDESITENYSAIAPRLLNAPRIAPSSKATAQVVSAAQIAPAPTPAPETLSTPAPAPSGVIKSGAIFSKANIKTRAESGSVAEAEKAAEEESAESAEEETESKTSEKTETETDKILGMPKMVAYGLGAVIVLVGGFIAYKKFKNKK
jgi:hypothetical protein